MKYTVESTYDSPVENSIAKYEKIGHSRKQSSTRPFAGVVDFGTIGKKTVGLAIIISN